MAQLLGLGASTGQNAWYMQRTVWNVLDTPAYQMRRYGQILFGTFSQFFVSFGSERRGTFGPGFDQCLKLSANRHEKGNCSGHLRIRFWQAGATLALILVR